MKTWSLADRIHWRPVTNLTYSISNPNKNLEIIKAYGFNWGPPRTSESRLVLASQTYRKDCSLVFSNGNRFYTLYFSALHCVRDTISCSTCNYRTRKVVTRNIIQRWQCTTQMGDEKGYCHTQRCVQQAKQVSFQD